MLVIERLGFCNDAAQVDRQTGDLWYFDGPRLRRYDPDSKRHFDVFAWPWPTAIGRLIHFPMFGGVLVSLEGTGGGVWWSPCGAPPYVQVLRLSRPTSYVLNWGVADTIDGVYVGEYGLGEGDAANLWFSEDGQEWRLAAHWPDRHMHFVAQDPYGGALHVSVGDRRKAVYSSANKAAIWREERRCPADPMALAFSRNHVIVGTDALARNCVSFLPRNGAQPSHLSLPESRHDMQVYDLAVLHDVLLATVRMSSQLPDRRPGAVLSIDQQLRIVEVSQIEAWYLTTPSRGRVYTCRTEDTVSVRTTAPWERS